MRQRDVKVICNDHDGYGWFEFDWEEADPYELWEVGDILIVWGTRECIVVAVREYYN